MKLDNIGVALLKSASDKETTVNRHVLITGLGRGGTTAIAQVFKAFGFYFDNPTLVMESIELRSLLLNRKTEQLSEHIRVWQTSPLRHAWKDPKLRAPKFKDFISSLPSDISLVIVFRDLIATTLRHNSVTGGYFLEELERNSRTVAQMMETVKYQQASRTVILVSYEKLLTNTESVISRLANIFDITEIDKIADAVNAIEVSPKSYVTACEESIKKIKQLGY